MMRWSLSWALKGAEKQGVVKHGLQRPQRCRGCMRLMLSGGMEDSQLCDCVLVLRPPVSHPSFLQIFAQPPPFFIIPVQASAPSLSVYFLPTQNLGKDQVLDIALFGVNQNPGKCSGGGVTSLICKISQSSHLPRWFRMLSSIMRQTLEHLRVWSLHSPTFCGETCAKRPLLS